MKAILLAAGVGSRLRPLSRILPKCLIPINGRPLLEYWLDSLLAAGIGPLLVNTHYLADQVQNWVKGYNACGQLRITFEEKLLGTAGTLFANRDFVGDEPILLIHADNLSLIDFAGFQQAHRQRPVGTEITMMTFVAPDPRQCGILELDERGVVQGFHEKVSDPPGNLANAAVYVVEPSVLDFLASLNKRVIDFSTEVLPHYLGRIYTHHNSMYHRDLGTLEALLAAQVEFPLAARVPAGHDSWKKFCDRYKLLSTEGVEQVLAEALGAKVMIYRYADLNMPSFPNASIGNPGQLYVLHVTDTSDYGNTVLRLTGEGFPPENLLLYFPRVSTGFSAKDIYERFNLRSFAFCATR